MLLLKSKTNNPYFNIATEEYLLKSQNEDILFLYTNAPSVIIGKHQIHNLEANLPYITKNQIPVIRRISGGGSVFHDLGNLNYCIISSQQKAWVDFEKFTQPLICFIKYLGLHPELRSKSDIRINGKKISGNASHIYKNRILHHGSILFDTDLDQLTTTLKNKPSCYHSKTVHSRRSIVTNITSHLQTPLGFKKFQEDFTQWLHKNASFSTEIVLDKNETESIQNLVTEKYQTKEWNVSYNGNYTFKNTFSPNNKLTQITIEVQKGICKSIKAKGTLSKEIQTFTQNVPHETLTFTKTLKSIFKEEEVLNHFF